MKILLEEFLYVKTLQSDGYSPIVACADTGRHMSTILNIYGSTDYKQYADLVKSEHQEIAFSLRDHVLYLHKLVFDHNDGHYQVPRTAKYAIRELILEEGGKI